MPGPPRPMDIPKEPDPAPRAIARRLVAREAARAALAVLALPVEAVLYLARRRRMEAALREDLSAAAGLDALPDLELPRDRPISVFISCAEASGELHALGLVEALRALCREHGAPPPELVGLGGARLAAAGVELCGRPVERAAMGFDGVLRALPYYARLLTDAVAHLGARRPDLFLPVDSPALSVPLARAAQSLGIRVVHYVTPQHWGWAPWRVRGYRRAVDLALAILPFERRWFERNGVPCKYVGHPELDAHPRRSAGGGERAAGSARRLVLLPGSRLGVVDRNLSWMLDAARMLESRLPGLEIVVAHALPELEPALRDAVRGSGAGERARVSTGDLHGELERADAALSVSGTILIDLLHHRLPAVVVYRLAGGRETWMARHFLSTPWFASVNLLAGRAVYPEFSFHGRGPLEEVADALVRALGDEAWRAGCRAGLELAATRLGDPGAGRRAAAQALGLAFPARGPALRPHPSATTLGPRARRPGEPLGRP